MSSSNETPRRETPFEMLAGTEEAEHPIDLVVASRLPQTELKQKIRDAIDSMLIALDCKQSLWMELEHLINERHTARYEAYFNLGYEYGIAAGRAEAFGKLIDNADVTTHQLGNEVRALVKNRDVPLSAILAVLLETAWSCVHDIQPDSPAAES